MNNKMSPVSFFSIRLEMFLEGKNIGKATGFIYQPKEIDKKFLVTNYHVITASSPEDPKSILNGYPDCPDEIQFSIFSKNDSLPLEGSFSLRKEDDPSYLEHKNRDKGVDIIAIPIEFPDDAIIVTQRQLGLVDDINFEIGSDLFIVGFPHGFGAGDFFPIWKRGTVASEPLFNPEGLSRFYIDALTKPGMSGSPVFATENRDIINISEKDALLFDKYKRGEIGSEFLYELDVGKMKDGAKTKFFQLVGIYSGRVILNEKDPNIGIVWQKQLIDELFLDPKIVKHPFPHE